MKKPGSNSEWEAWGRLDPLYGVAAWAGRAKEESNPWTADEFFELGEADWRDFSKRWQRYGLNPRSCVEIGCGAGRITKQLATYFEKVEALDVSADMIEYARTHLDAANVRYHHSQGTDIPVPDNSITAVFSSHVFQHFDSLDVAHAYFCEIARVLEPGGSLMIHLPVHHWPTMPQVFDGMYRAKKRIGDIRAFVRQRLMEVGIAKPFMRGLSYPIEFFYGELPKLGLESVELSVFATTSNNAAHAFVFATRSGQLHRGDRYSKVDET